MWPLASVPRCSANDLPPEWDREKGPGARTLRSWLWLNLWALTNALRQINYISKAPGLPDAPITVPGRQFQSFGDLSVNRPRVHDFLKEMHREVLSHYDCFA